MIKKFTSLFPLWAVLLSAVAYVYPEYFIPYKGSIVPLLSLIMLGMGVTLSVDSFLAVLKRPYVVILGTLMQYTLMPLAAWIVCLALKLPADLAAGVILLGCCPGGTASNVICYLAKGDVALSIVLTSVSTMVAFLATPFLTWLFIGQTVDVDVMGMLVSVVNIVIVPVVLGLSINYFFEKRITAIKDVFPAISALAIVVIIAIIIGANSENLEQSGLMVLVAVILHNSLGLAGGYGVAKAFKLSEKEARTLAIEVGMQNSGLSVALAIKHFTAAAALPGAIFSIWHNLSGAFLAGHWSKTSVPDPDKSEMPGINGHMH
ncbi:MAG: bile acid:sodium symporter family protein [Methanosarcina sp.]|uniref:bile acid:sodium symporter family protein n=1 Tax=Methanosarcina sp. TaxID=2213 RepID=UPI00261213CD|nr:bile acid:sodium symporter family protein [Methanosarcina sp.]MDD3247213.1 bile acid:sodium symporter family protein [Methanosarcina sp.]MDD4248291.1 bile acid:sodium symporter family protein [Methanosarcina sp.]